MQLFSALAPAEMMASETAGFSMGHRYCYALDECQPAVAAVLSAIADAADGIVLFHCAAGKDRTGIIAALLLANAGVRPQIIVEDYALTATSAPQLLQEMRDRAIKRGGSGALMDVIFAAAPAQHGADAGVSVGKLWRRRSVFAAHRSRYPDRGPPAPAAYRFVTAPSRPVRMRVAPIYRYICEVIISDL